MPEKTAPEQKHVSGGRGRDQGEAYFVDRQRFRENVIGALVGGSMVFWTFWGRIVFGGGWTSGEAWMWLILGVGLAVLGVVLWTFELTTEVRPDGVHQRSRLRLRSTLGLGDTTVPSREIRTYHVVENGTSDGELELDSLPTTTGQLIRRWDLSGVYVTTAGEPPTFWGMAGGKLGFKMSTMPGFLVTDRPRDLAAAIERIR